MDFLKEKVSTLFLNRHGEIIYEGILIKIEQEKKEKCTDDYIELVFKVAFFDYWELHNDSIEAMLKDLYDFKVNVEELKKIHKVSIGKIQEYMKKSIDKLAEE